MYAIIQTGGKQFRVKEGMRLRVERLEAAEGDEVQIREVLAVGDGGETFVGTPFLPHAYVVAKVLGHGKGRKVMVFRFKRRKDYKKKRGHRQPYTDLLIEKIVKEGTDGP
jgi:large subunit ribosomal protein L21